MISNILRAAEINALVERVKCDYLAINTQDRHSRVVCNGSIVYNLDIVNSNTSLDNQCIVLADASAGNIELQLPDATIATNRVYVIIKIDGTSNSVTCVPVSGQYINGLTSISLDMQYTWLELVNDSSNWWVIQSYSQVGGGSPTPYFTINLVPTSISSPPNSSTNLTLTITPYNNFTGTVNLSLSNAPSGVSISPTSVNVPGSNPVVSTITLTIGNVAPNTYNIVFNAISGGIHVYANLSLTIQQYGSGSNYGYVCGGYNYYSSSTLFSTIDRFQFPFDSGTANQIGNLSGSRSGLSANNSSTYGYVCGGGPYSTIDRFQFPFNSGTANQVGNLSEGRSELSANNSSTYGYVCGGGGYGYFSTIDRFQFPFDSGTANHVGNLSGSRGYLSANNSSTHSYVCGGYTGDGGRGYFLSTIDRFQFPFNSGTANQVGNLSGSRCLLGANNSSTYGYVCGGGYSSVYLSTIDRFQFPFNSGTASKVGNLSGSRNYLSANNSSTYGYVCGGDSSGSTYLSTIDRFQFPFDSGTANQVGNLSGTRRDSSAVDGVDFVTMFV